MNISRRRFLAVTGAMLGSAATGKAQNAYASRQPKAPPNPYGCVVDLTACVGCRTCEQACNRVNHLPPPEERLDDRTVLDYKRRPSTGAFTVINRYYSGRLDAQNQLVPTYVKVQCMHCQDPACASACITGALHKKENGAVSYDKSKCVGCRYCLMACPFQIPAYEYFDPLAPRVRKCTFCYDRISVGGKPACAAACPMEAITFGHRQTILEVTHRKIAANPGRYLNKVYGEFEVGGTSWMYISREPFEKLGFLTLPHYPMPHLTETIQHTIFAYMWAPITLFTILAGAMWKINPQQINNAPGLQPQEDAV